MREVALVAHRLGENAAARLQLRAIVVGPEAGRAQRLEVVDGAPDRRPHLGEERAVGAEAEALHHREDQLAVAVVLGAPVGAVATDAARHVAVGTLPAGVPAHEHARLRVAAEAQQRGDHRRAVADPGARVPTRTRLQGRAVALHEDVADRRARDGFVLARRGWQLEGRRIEPGAPVPHRLVERRRAVGTADARDRCGVRDAERHGEVDVACRARREVEVESEGRGRVAERMGDGARRRQRAARQIRRDRAARERRRAEAARRSQRDDGALAVDPHRVVVPRQLGDAPYPAEIVNRLPRRIDLERPQRGEETYPALARRGVGETIAQIERRDAAPPRGERGGVQRELVGTPDRRRYR